MKFICYLSAGLIAIPIASCLPLAEAKVKAVREVDEPTILTYADYKKRDAEVDTPSVYEYGIYKKRDAEVDTPSV